jgi:diazepam-binding inhibitor (GABA receptor modulating acyl-CoA-binding protein)
MASALDKEFQEAFQSLSEMKESVAPDIMLKFYAYYKQATSGDIFSMNGESDVRNAFKFNAWTQLNGMSEDEAKQEYINLAKQVLTTNYNKK